MIKAVIFDCFGVLTGDPWLEFKKKHFKGAPEQAAQASRLNRQTDLGQVKYADFIEQVARLADISPKDAQLQITGHSSNDELLEYISQSLKPHYKIGLLSNAANNWLGEIFTPRQIELFDEIVLSCDVGYIKPQPEIYQIILEKLGVSAGESVFIDDREKSCAAARELGMHAIFYADFEQMKVELEKILAANPKS